MNKTSKIVFTVELDEKNLPEKIQWEADDAGFDGTREAKTLFLSLWDKEDAVTMGLDLWTKEMLIEEMNIHYHQMLVKLAESYQRATQDSDTAMLMKNFAADFAERLNLFKK
ncbi:gliding motility protein GldC [Ignavibacterium sp.]|uniref:gliding motility protein GldC n=1 Tax=Ignavibacterium sp. TaxID=2651167 RepID=UPI002201378A|nr:gliding motility protein GldC [Ignavibacterium sp.]BDQ03892.1 MAG: gliding motility protein GldC [Ignavibacterium sp.]